MRPAYVSAKQTKALLTHSAPQIRARLAAADMLTVAQAASLAHTEVATISRWIANGRAIALETRRNSYRLPQWQFEPAMWAAIPHVAMALDTTHSWALMSFLESPCGALGGRTPLQAIQQGDVREVLGTGLAESC